MTEPLKFEAGKHYRTRDSMKALCVHVWGNETAVFVCDDPDPHGSWCVYANGRYEMGHASPLDLVSEWREPRHWTVYITEFDATSGDVVIATFSRPDSGRIIAKATVTEGEGMTNAD